MSEYLNLKDLCRKSLEARRDLSLTQKDLADLLGVRQSSISQAENDRSGSMIRLQMRIIHKAGWKIVGPLWEFSEEDRT